MLARVPASTCVKCKGYRRLCGLTHCPILERFRSNIRASLSLRGLNLEGSTPPSVVVGESGYPMVPLMLGIPPSIKGLLARGYDDPIGWWGVVGLDEIIRRRSYLISPVVRVNVRDFERLYEAELSVAAASLRPVESEARLKKPPVPKLTFRPGLSPVGPSAEVRDIRVVGNASLPPKLEKLIWDDLSAQEGIIELYMSGVDVYSIIRSLSVGLLGRLRSRRLVPTRWAITAVDRALTNYFLRKIRFCNSISKVELYEGEYLGNRFKVILYQGRPLVEWIEIWHPMSVFTASAKAPVVVYNKSMPIGRTSTLDGGFDAARVAVMEYLERIRRKASAIIVREVTPDYYASVGNWHIRESLRRFFMRPPKRFASLEEAVNYVLERLSVGDGLRRELKLMLTRFRYGGLDKFTKG